MLTKMTGWKLNLLSEVFSWEITSGEENSDFTLILSKLARRSFGLQHHQGSDIECPECLRRMGVKAKKSPGFTKCDTA